MTCVVSMARPQKRTKEETAALKRLAIQIVAQLPEGQAEALAVLELAKTLVGSFLGDCGPIVS